MDNLILIKDAGVNTVRVAIIPATDPRQLTLEVAQEQGFQLALLADASLKEEEVHKRISNGIPVSTHPAVKTVYVLDPELMKEEKCPGMN